MGYDLVAVKGREELRIEVKGTSAKDINDVSVTLTPNEYAKSLKNQTKYRIVIVFNALTEPNLLEFYWVPEEKSWFSDQSLSYLAITEMTAAKLTISNE